jgi:biotin operon repressor
MSIRMISAAIDLDLSPSDKLILILLANNANDETGDCFPSQTYLAKRSGLSRGSVNRVIKRLETVGLVDTIPQYRDDGGRRSNRYRLNMNDTGGGVTTEHMGCDPVIQEPVTVGDSLTVISNRHKNHSETRGTRLEEDWELPISWRQWASKKRPDLHLDTVADCFKDHWISVGGVRGIKRDWSATWRNWVRREPIVGERKFSNSRPPWANLPRDDDKLPNHASVYGLSIAKQGETYPAYRMRLQTEITERLRVE